ncbi:MarR family winged helix-turn-helix transcriptional regulator [Breznakiella homolactica]|uniref:HTH-type transcriptional regulator SarZ n=1 Tax=Breznakiella homolactica TaxID=2798577 RepID=A0A7T8BA57_9SPIR|nr:MarR family transcriptional regulator [Breznakiella homolactica]QQO09182.1 MarR family transcriptional regulator [Breznakiella homolactica]
MDTKNLDSLCIGELASVLYRQYQAFINREMKEYGVNSSEFLYLIRIPDSGTVNQTYLAETVFCDNAIVSRSIQSLADKKLVARERSGEDKRAVMVSLTPAGRKAKQAGLEKRDLWKKTVMYDLSEKNSVTLIRTLKKMASRALSAAEDGNTKAEE